MLIEFYRFSDRFSPILLSIFQKNFIPILIPILWPTFRFFQTISYRFEYWFYYRFSKQVHNDLKTDVCRFSYLFFNNVYRFLTYFHRKKVINHLKIEKHNKIQHFWEQRHVIADRKSVRLLSIMRTAHPLSGTIIHGAEKRNPACVLSFSLYIRL